MSWLPKRVKDLPPLEPESEDDRTPIKPKHLIKNSSTIEKSGTCPLRPIRVSELPVLSDSEPDNDDTKMSSFNPENLNESFIICNNASSESIKENDKNILNEWDREKYSKDTGYGDSFAFGFNKSKLDDNYNHLSAFADSNKKQSIIQQSLPQSRRPFSFLNKAKLETIKGDGCTLFSLSEQPKSPIEFSSINLLPNIFKGNKEKQNISSTILNHKAENLISNICKSSKANSLTNNIHNPNQYIGVIKPYKSIDKDFQFNQEIIDIKNTNNNEGPPILQQQQTSNCKIIPDKKSTIDNISLNLNNMNIETPYKLNDINFITPQIKSSKFLPISRQPFNMGSTVQRTRMINNENEIRSQKILFQTPYAVSRPPVSSITNYSISLGLDDTPTAPPTDIINSPSLSAEKNEYNKKKSSDAELFKSIEKNHANSEMHSNENKSEITKINTTAENETKQKEKIVLINHKEYIILKKLGSGGSSSVFLAQRKDIKLECALKIVDLRGDELVIEGYLNETKLLAKLQGNINVVSLFEYEHIEKRSQLLMVMEKGDSDLYKILQSYKSDLPLHILMNYWLQILQAVDYIHKNGVIHSDLKPANFLMINGRLKLIDFGIASRIPNDSTSIIKFSQAGTFNYISPEALIDISTGNSPCKDQPKIKISTKSDVWSLGCMLYLFLYKKTPFGHIRNNFAKAELISNSNTVIEYPEVSYYYPSMLIEMAKKCLIHNPKKRLSVAELLKYPFHMVIPVDNL